MVPWFFSFHPESELQEVPQRGVFIDVPFGDCELDVARHLAIQLRFQMGYPELGVFGQATVKLISPSKTSMEQQAVQSKVPAIVEDGHHDGRIIVIAHNSTGKINPFRHSFSKTDQCMLGTNAAEAEGSGFILGYRLDLHSRCVFPIASEKNTVLVRIEMGPGSPSSHVVDFTSDSTTGGDRRLLRSRRQNKRKWRKQVMQEQLEDFLKEAGRIARDTRDHLQQDILPSQWITDL